MALIQPFLSHPYYEAEPAPPGKASFGEFGEFNVCSKQLNNLTIGNATRVPENPGNPPVFKPVNPCLCAGKNPGLTGLISGVSQYSVHCAEKRAETEST